MDHTLAPSSTLGKLISLHVLINMALKAIYY